MARRTGTLSIFAALLALMLALWAPAALAHHKDGHTKGGGSSAGGSDHDGDADSDSNTAYTEDNDTNDDEENNVADDGDNAHPSGKDRSVESGGSGNQGNSESNPDDSKGPMRYEGELGDDKPNGPGGTDLEDQDGNNGCGNDDDFDDDNNGWCGKPTERGSSADHKPADEVQGTVTVVEGDDKEKDVEENPATPADNVLGIRVTAAPSAPEVAAAAAVAPAAVAAAPEAAGAVLPFTGSSDLLPFVAIALMLIGIGALGLRARRNEA